MDRTTPTGSPGRLHVEELYVEEQGEGPPLTLIHGFTQTGRCWGPISGDLATDHRLLLVDAPGHGRSSQVVADLVEGGRMIAEQTGPSTVIGYSMGGRFALHAALERPELVSGLVLIGATAGIEDPAEQEARVADDEQRATRIEEIGVPAFVDEWLSLPLFAGLSPSAACREERVVNTAAGLASSLRHAGTGTQVPTWDRLSDLSMPALVVAGADDTKFVDLGRRLTEGIGARATFATIDGAGHTAHLEQPERFLSILRSWLEANSL